MVRLFPLRTCTAAAVLVALAGAAVAQSDTPANLDEQVGGTVDAARQTQQQLDDWSGERAGLETRYRAAKANIDYLRNQLARQDEKARALDDAVAELERRMAESGRLQAVIQDTLDVTLARLEQAVARDLPFLPGEREARLAGLRRHMAQPDLNAAEKLRRVLEALLVEAQYGETVDVSPRTVVIDGQEVHADVLRIGRLAMFWKSPDGGRVGTWDPVSEAWVGLPGRYNRTVTRAMEMATRMRPVALIEMPLGRIEPVEVAR
jgi:hypothetical protein